MSRGNGYWVRGDQIKDVTFENHIDDIIRMPEAFGLSKEDVQNAHRVHGERLGQEGKARDELIKKASERGWIRVRYYSGHQGDYWSVQFDEISKREKAVKNFLAWAVYESKVMHRNDDVRLLGYKDGYFKEIRGVGDYLQEAKIEKGFLRLAESLKEMLPEKEED